MRGRLSDARCATSAERARYAELLNNDLAATPRGTSQKSASCFTRLAAEGSSAMQVVEVWTQSAFLRERIGSAGRGMHQRLCVRGSGCAAEAATLRPRTAPATVKRLNLKTRPALEKYRLSVPPPKLPRKPKTPILQRKETTEKSDAVPGKEGPIQRQLCAGESPRRDQLKKRRALAKCRAETELRQLLSDDGVETTERLRFLPYIEPSPIPEMPGTVCFKGLPSEKEQRGLIPVKGKNLAVRFPGMASTPVRLAFLKAGFRVTNSPTKWSVLWGVAPSNRIFEKMNRFQRVNHFPGSGELGRKDKLCRNYLAMQKLQPEAFRFMPKCFVLPEDRVALRQDVAKHPGRRYIVKPVASSCGRGIRITSNPATFTCAKECVVQRYVAKPMTIDGFKFDLRIYAAATSFQPLRAYVYSDGLVRFATQSYTVNKGEIDNRFVHITNTSVNRRSGDYVKNRHIDATDVGSKWSLRAFRSYVMRHRLVEWRHVWTQVREIVAKTFRCVAPRMSEHLRSNRVPFSTSCFEIYGFDILLDASHRAWLLEVNTWPDLAGTSPLDQKLKTELIEDTMHMVGIVPRPRSAATTENTSSTKQAAAEERRRGSWEVAVT